MTMTLDGTAGMTAPQGAVYNGIAMASAQASTSGTSIDFTNIPVWARRITVMMNGLNTSGSSPYLIQIGSGTITSSGYTSYATVSASAATSSAGFLQVFNNATGYTHTGTSVLTLLTGNTWICSGLIGRSVNYFVSLNAGVGVLSGILDRVRITTVSGTDTFVAGTINIMYE